MSYSVSQVQTAQLADYESWDVCWFCHNATFPDEAIDSPLRKHQTNHDWDTICDQAVAAGNVSAICAHAIDQAGFRFYDTGKDMSPHVMQAQSFPKYATHYTIASSTLSVLGLTPNHLFRFHSAARSRGLKAGFYINIGQAVNLFDAVTYTNNESSKAVWLEFLLKEIKWITYLYDWDFAWVDFSQHADFSDTQNNNLYQTLKEQNGLLVIRNSPSGMANFAFPADVKQAESAVIPADEGFWLPATTVNATEYYIPSGLAYTGLYSETDPGGVQSVMWQAVIRDTPQAGLNENLVRDQATFNTWYTYAKDRNVPFFVNMPLFDGVLDATYYDRVKASNLIAS